MDYQIQIGQAKPQATAVVRRQASLAELTKVIPHGCGAVWKTIKPLQLTGVGRHIALYLDDEIHLDELPHCRSLPQHVRPLHDGRTRRKGVG